MALTKIQDILLSLVRVGLNFEEPSSKLKENLEGLNQENWNELLVLASKQGMTAVCFDALQKIDVSSVAPQFIILKFIGSDMLFKRKYAEKRRTTAQLLKIFGENNIPVLTLKGMSMNRYYPVPEHRYSGDIDIYLGDNYGKGNRLLLNNGAVFAGIYYRHSELRLGKEIIENHCWLSNKGEGESENLELSLRKFADESLQTGKVGEEIFPNANFNALFLSFHAYGHFLYEAITLRHVTDWAMFLINESKYVDIDMYKKAKQVFLFGKFADVMTKLVLDYLKILRNNIPKEIIEDALLIDTELSKKVIEHIFIDTSINHWDNPWKVRWNIVKKMFQNRWKFKELSNIGFFGMIYRKTKFVLFENKE